MADTINASVETATTAEPSPSVRVASAQSISLSAGIATAVEPSVVLYDETGWAIGNQLRETDSLAVTDTRLTHDRLTLSWTGHVSAVDRVRPLRDHAGDVTQVVDSDGSWEGVDRSNDNNTVTVKPPQPLRPPLVADDYVVENYRERGGDSGLVRDIQVRFLRQSPRGGSSSLSQTAGSDEWSFAFSEGTVATADVEVGDPGPQGDVEFRMQLAADQTEAVLASLTRLEAVSVESVPDGDDFVRDNTPTNANTVTISRPSSLDSEYLPDEGAYVVRDLRVERSNPRWTVRLTARKT